MPGIIMPVCLWASGEVEGSALVVMSVSKSTVTACVNPASSHDADDAV